MSQSVDFLRDEVRNGFYITTAIKQAWAETLDVLGEIDRICKKYNIKYFADWGTFLGAVRHGGFVPWDDDLDICMLRDDYEKFMQVADSELPKGYVIHDYAHKEDHWLFLSRVVNNEKMCFEEDYLLKHNNFPWLAGVDVFLKDYLYEDEEDEKKRDAKVMELIAVADMITDGKHMGTVINEKLREINKKYFLNISLADGKRKAAVELYAQAERIMAEVDPKDTSKVGQIFPWVLKDGLKRAEKKSDYETLIRLPFEDTTIPVPAAYNQVLASRYGDYLTIRKEWDAHEYPFFEGQREEMEKLSGSSFCRFEFSEEMFERLVVDKSSALKTTVRDCLDSFYKLLNNAGSELENGDVESASKALADCQGLAMDIGSLIEAVKGENRKSTKTVISSLERFCEALWREYQALASGEDTEGFKLSKEALVIVADTVRDDLLHRKEILFLPMGPTEWKGFEGAYKEALAEENADVYVVPLPLMKKDFFGNIIMSDDEIAAAVEAERYPEGLELTDFWEYDISTHCPDRVYIQNPYDGTNPCLTVPVDFYAENIRRFSEEVVFIQAAKNSDIGPKNVNDIYNLRIYAVSPGVIYSDRVYVHSDNIREWYIKALTEFAGKKTEEIWEKKIFGKEPFKEGEIVGHDKKKLVFCIGANELQEKREVFVNALESRLETVVTAGEKIDAYLCFYPEDRDQWRDVDRELSNKIFSMTDFEVKSGKLKYISLKPSRADDFAKDYDAYYGSPSPLVPAFVTAKKPVMISDYSV
ncbi:MAG: LicD family protein [Lachnospiraceae bacterium]|nr:LicD family protein [Lachnospiraceae bacterium]